MEKNVNRMRHGIVKVAALAAAITGTQLDTKNAIAQSTPFRLERLEPALSDVKWLGVTTNLDRPGSNVPVRIEKNGTQLHVCVTPGVRIYLRGKCPAASDYPGWNLAVSSSTTATERSRQNASAMQLEIVNEHSSGQWIVATRAPEEIGQRRTGVLNCRDAEGKNWPLTVTVEAVAPENMPRGDASPIITIPPVKSENDDSRDPSPDRRFEIQARAMNAIPHGTGSDYLPGGELEFDAFVTRHLALGVIAGIHSSQAGVILKGDASLPQTDPRANDRAVFESQGTINLGGGAAIEYPFHDYFSARLSAMAVLGYTLPKTDREGYTFNGQAGIGICGYAGFNAHLGNKSSWSIDPGIYGCASQLKSNHARWGAYLGVTKRF